MSNNHVSRSASIKVNTTPDEALPLFTPVGETLWIDHWNPEYVYPEDGEAMTGNVWKTVHDDTEVIWVTINYDAEKHTVTYINVMPNIRVTRIDIQCDALDDSKTSAQVKYTLTALGERGSAYIEKFTEDHYKHMMHSWENMISHYLHHGEALAS